MPRQYEITQDYIGRRAGKLVIIGNIVPSQGDTNNGGLWKCLCECGNECTTTGYNLNSRKGCGCTRKTAEGHRIGGLKQQRFAKSTVTYRYSKHRTQCATYRRTPLSRNEWERIVFRPCHYCGDTDIHNIAKGYRGRTRKTGLPTPEDLARYEVKMNGVDRLDSMIGYEPFNCVPCCTVCNRMKCDYTITEFAQQIKDIHEFNTKT